MRQGTRENLREQRTVCAPIARAVGGHGLRQRIVEPCGRGSKRLTDVLLAASLLVLLLPVLVIVAVVIKLESPGPVFYRCTRVGLGFRPLRVLKFRKMVNGARGPALTSADDPRFTRCGRWLAATKLDELPQFWNVLKGEMSLVGPRPEDPEFVAMHKHEYTSILAARPGITGLSQLAFAREAAILGSQDRVAGYVDRLLPAKVKIDLLYVQRRDLAMDIRILAWTALVVLLRLDVAVHRQSGRINLRRRPEARREEQRASELGLGHATGTLADQRAGQPVITVVKK